MYIQALEFIKMSIKSTLCKKGDISLFYIRKNILSNFSILYAKRG